MGKIIKWDNYYVTRMNLFYFFEKPVFTPSKMKVYNLISLFFKLKCIE